MRKVGSVCRVQLCGKVLKRWSGIIRTIRVPFTASCDLFLNQQFTARLPQSAFVRDAWEFTMVEENCSWRTQAVGGKICLRNI